MVIRHHVREHKRSDAPHVSDYIRGKGSKVVQFDGEYEPRSYQVKTSHLSIFQTEAWKNAKKGDIIETRLINFPFALKRGLKKIKYFHSQDEVNKYLIKREQARQRFKNLSNLRKTSQSSNLAEKNERALKEGYETAKPIIKKRLQQGEIFAKKQVGKAREYFKQRKELAETKKQAEKKQAESKKVEITKEKEPLELNPT